MAEVRRVSPRSRPSYPPTHHAHAHTHAHKHQETKAISGALPTQPSQVLKHPPNIHTQMQTHTREAAYKCSAAPRNPARS